MSDFTSIEGDLKIGINGVATAWNLDEPSDHRLTHCMKAVDVTVERANCYQFIEFKNPRAPGAMGQ